MKKFRLLFILFILLMPNSVNAVKNCYYRNGNWVCSGSPIDGTECHYGGRSWLCDTSRGDNNIYHCIDPGESSPPGKPLIVQGEETDPSILTIASEGLDADAICTIREYRGSGSCWDSKSHLSAAARRGDYKLGGSNNLDGLNYTITFTETEWDENLIKQTDNIFSKKFILKITKNNFDTTGVNLDYSVEVNTKRGNSNIQVVQKNVSGSLDGTLTAEVLVYSKKLITLDIDTVNLTASVYASKHYSTVCWATRGGSQSFIGECDGGYATKDFHESTSFPVTKTCQYKIVTDPVTGQEYPEYTMHVVRPGTDRAEEQKVDAVTFMKKGCCSDVQPKFFNTKTKEGREAIEYYKNNCMTKDLVSYENECGTDSCDGEKNYKSYSTSFVWQVPMDTLKKNVLKDIKFTDVNNSNDKLKHYYDESLSNKYCKVVTSEDNEIYFPTTAAATSGRFFVFQELNKKECDLTTLNYNSKTCFRQPYIHGKISLYVMTDYTSWKNDYDAAVSEQTQACGNTSGDDANSLQNTIACQDATTKVNSLNAAKASCEDKINNFEYNLEPTLTFSYEQAMPLNSIRGTCSDKRKNSKTGEEECFVKENISMYATKTSDDPVKYWPNVTTDVTKTNNIKYTFSSNNVYENTYEKTVYYRPKLYSYSLLPSGEVKTKSFQSVSKTIENGLEVGYVYNVKVTSYEGIYNTWFDIDNLGNGGKNSNLHKMVIQEYKAASRKDYNNDESLMFKSQCKFCMEEGSFQRECNTCEDLEPKFVFRNVALDNITPNGRDTDTNWVDDKGNKAKWLISQTSGNNIAVASTTSTDKEMLDNAGKTIKVTTLESDGKKASAVQTANAKDYIYDDSTGEYLEYDITLTTEDMRLIKENNRKFDYATLNLCANNYTGNNSKSGDEDYCFKCNQDGKECESTFLDAYASSTVGRSKWKYYFYNPDNPDESTFIKGTMASGDVLTALKKIQGNENGRYPDPENQQGWLNTYKNWP